MAPGDIQGQYFLTEAASAEEDEQLSEPCLFGSDAPRRWTEGTPVIIRGMLCTPFYCDAADNCASPQEQIHATEQNSASAEPEPTGLQASPQTGATEHSLAPLVLLAAADIDFQRALEESEFKPPRSLHRLARGALNEIIRAGVNSDIDRNLEHWFP